MTPTQKRSSKSSFNNISLLWALVWFYRTTSFTSPHCKTRWTMFINNTILKICLFEKYKPWTPWSLWQFFIGVNRNGPGDKFNNQSHTLQGLGTTSWSMVKRAPYWWKERGPPSQTISRYKILHALQTRSCLLAFNIQFPCRSLVFLVWTLLPPKTISTKELPGSRSDEGHPNLYILLCVAPSLMCDHIVVRLGPTPPTRSSLPTVNGEFMSWLRFLPFFSHVILVVVYAHPVDA